MYKLDDTLSHMRLTEYFTQEEKKLSQYLKSRNLKLTTGRHIIFEEVLRIHGHFAAEDLLKTLKKKSRQVSRATVYRSLREFLEAGIIRETAFGEKHHHYEHLYDEKPHHHARCLRCSALIEFPDLAEDRIYIPFLQRQGFKILGHEMHFYGVCKDCQTEP